MAGRNIFVVNNAYSREEIGIIAGIPPEKRQGNWNTGYASFAGDWFFFCNIGIPGRSGPDYPNHFDGDCLVTFAKGRDSRDSKSMTAISSTQTKKYIFYREEERAPWIFAGLGTLVGIEDSQPLRLTWAFLDSDERRDEKLPEEIYAQEIFYEGAHRHIVVNSYERNINARRKCIEHFGARCTVCTYDFEKVWGEIGRGFIHVHHVVEISTCTEEYIVDPLRDLVPACPNCHAIIHRRRPPYSIEQVRGLLRG